jgi:glycosyltransferase involved in cell wall biosynthesis
MHQASKILMVVSDDLPDGPIQNPHGPRKDYVALAEALPATVLDRSQTKRSPIGRLLSLTLGMPVAQAYLAAQERNHYDAIVTDGEHIGIPLALLLKVLQASTPHITIGHRLSSSKKQAFFHWLGIHSHMARIAVHARRQYDHAVHELGISSRQVAFVPWQVDTRFWSPEPDAEEDLVCSVGLEFRDYPTLMQAVDGLNVRVMIGAASRWSRRRNTADEADRPANVHVGSFDFRALRDLYARSAIVVVPLYDVDFQAGITTILEAMAMGKAVIVTSTQGQTDVVVDRRRTVRGVAPRPESLLRQIAEHHGIDLEPNGLYVAPGDSAELRRAITFLLDHPEERARLGAAGRRTVERLLTVDQFADRMCALVNQACEAHAESSWRPASPLSPRPSSNPSPY